MQEWQANWDAAAPEPKHRHVSHLYGLFQSGQIDMDETPALAAAARRSLELRGDESTGWATAWRAALWARLRDGERAHGILRFRLGPGRTYPNMWGKLGQVVLTGDEPGERVVRYGTARRAAQLRPGRPVRLSVADLTRAWRRRRPRFGRGERDRSKLIAGSGS